MQSHRLAVKAVLILLMLTSCGAHLRSIAINKIQAQNERISSCGKVLDIPVYKDSHGLPGQRYIYWLFAKEKEKELGLNSPECGTDSLLFRMHMTSQGGSHSQAHALLEMRKDSNGFKGTLVFMRVDFKTYDLKEQINRKFVQEVTPQSSWLHLIDSLRILKYQELKTDEEIPGYGSNTQLYANNSMTYSFEYSDLKKYRFYQYSGIFSKASVYPDVANAAKLADLLEREFSIQSKGCAFFGCE